MNHDDTYILYLYGYMHQINIHNFIILYYTIYKCVCIYTYTIIFLSLNIVYIYIDIITTIAIIMMMMMVMMMMMIQWVSNPHQISKCRKATWAPQPAQLKVSRVAGPQAPSHGWTSGRSKSARQCAAVSWLHIFRRT